VHDGDDRREDEEWDTGAPAAEPRQPTDRVRIIGAEPAGEATQVVPVVPRTVTPVESPEPSTEPAVRLTDQPGQTEPDDRTVHPVRPGETAVPGYTEPESDWPADDRTDHSIGSTPQPTELPHWTEAPTGQVPAVLARESGDNDPNPSGISGPAWREEHSDWVAHEEEFEPAMFGDDEAALGSLDETDRTDDDRRPWEFDLPSSGSPAVPTGTRPTPVGSPSTSHFDVTGEVPVVDRQAARAGSTADASRDTDDRVGVPSGGQGSIDGSSDDRSDRPDDTPDEIDDLPGLQRTRPTGTSRSGRIRRSGAGRVQAKRPEEMDALTDSPLAAEPPGASVTAVPGAGRRRGSLAGLAAADRTAIEEADHSAEASGDPTGSAASSRDLTTAAFDSGAPTRAVPTGRRPVVDEPEGQLGGGPPDPRRPRQRAADGTGGGIRVRIGTGIGVAVVALVAFSLGTLPSLILSILVLTFAAGECFGVLRRAGYHPATLLGLVGTVSLMIAAYDKGATALPLVLVLISAFTLIWYLLGIEHGPAVAGSAATMLTIGWVSLLGSYAALLLSPSTYPHREGIAFLLGAIIATVANDVGALVVGGWIGRHPLAPTISPNKTWEGLLGGAVFSVVVSTAVVGQIHPWTPGKAALLGLVVAVVAPIGDLCESLLKRDLRLKDMGTLLPGHGGVLDRVDALLFVLPATYYLVRALHIG
jgi:phosphatidate cytidylyltransferase